MIKVVCRRAYAAAQGHELLTAGMVRAVEVAFEFSQDWQELEKTAVFTDGTVTCTVAQSAWEEGARVHVPQDVLTVPGRRVRVGVYGTDADGTVLPTVWAELGVVLPGADPSGDPSTDPSLPVWAQLQAQIGDLNDLLTDAKESLVAAINEVVQTGGGGGGDEPAESCAVTWNLSNVSSSSEVVSVPAGAALVAVLTPDAGYTLGDVTVTMGGATLPGVWDAGTSTVTISSVTGDVVIFCVGVKMPQMDTSPVIEVTGKGITAAGRVYAKDEWGYTKFYPISDTSVSLFFTNNGSVATPTSSARMTVFLDTDDGTTPFTVLAYANPLAAGAVGTLVTFGTLNGATGLRASLVLADTENCYAYETNTGNVIFAGRDTPYYGLTNIGRAPETVQSLSVDQDIAMDYSVATASVLGEDPAEDPKATYGVSEELADLVTEAKNAWMTEYGGDCRKIPLIITTDQHGRTNPGLFSLLGKTLSMHDISKICNLGDTVSVEWRDADPAHPLLSCAQLEKWCESMKEIPFSKQLTVFGNHDTWYGNYADAGNPVGTRYPSSQAQLNQYFRNIYVRRTNNNGWFSVKDDQFNVKYVVISGFEYKDGSVAFRVSTAQMTWLIEELSRNDSYDVVLVSHVPLHYKTAEMSFPDGDSTSEQEYRVFGIDTDALFAARKNKSAGTITDSDGVQHSYDFTACETPLLCALHGHTHIDAYNYVGGSLLSYSFDWFDGCTVFFVLLDRAAQKLIIWKVEGDAQSVKSFEVALSAAGEA